MERSLALFTQMLEDQESVQSEGAALKSFAATVDATYHDLCAALIHDPTRLARLVSSYKTHLLK